MTFWPLAFGIPFLLHCFDSFIERHSARVRAYELYPQFRYLMWGKRECENEWKSFLIVKTPFLVWDSVDYGRDRSQGWCRWDLVWRSGEGWTAYPIPIDYDVGGP